MDDFFANISKDFSCWVYIDSEVIGHLLVVHISLILRCYHVEAGTYDYILI